MAEFRLDIDFAPIARLNNELKTLVSSINGISTELNKGASKIQTQTKKAASGIKKEAEGLNKVFDRMSFVITATLSYKVWSGFIQGLTEATSDTKKLESSLIELKSLFVGVSGGDSIAERLYGDVDKLSIKYGAEIDEVTEAIYNNVSAGRLGADANKVVASSFDLATTAGSNLANTLRIVNRVINAYGLEASSASSVTSTLMQIIQKGDVQFKEMESSFGKVAAAAGRSGLRFEEVAAMYARIVQVLPAREAATALTNVLNKLREHPEQIKAIRQSGFENWLQDTTELSNKQLKALVGNQRGLRAMDILLVDTAKTAELYNYFVKEQIDVSELAEKQLGSSAKELDGMRLEIRKIMRENFGEFLIGLEKAFLSLSLSILKSKETMILFGSVLSAVVMTQLPALLAIIPKIRLAWAGLMAFMQSSTAITIGIVGSLTAGLYALYSIQRDLTTMYKERLGIFSGLEQSLNKRLSLLADEQTILDKLSKSWGEYVGFERAIKEAVDRTINTYTVLHSQLRLIEAEYEKFYRKAFANNKLSDSEKKRLNELGFQLDAIKANTEEYEKMSDVLLRAHESGVNTFSGMINFINSVGDIAEETRKKLLEMFDPSKEQEGKVRQLRDEIEELTADLEILSAKEKAGVISKDALNDSIENLIYKYRSLIATGKAEGEEEIAMYKLMASLATVAKKAAKEVDPLIESLKRLSLELDLLEFGVGERGAMAIFGDLDAMFDGASGEVKLQILRLKEKLFEYMEASVPTPTRENPILKWIGMDDREHNWVSQAIEDVKGFVQKFQATISAFTSSISSLWDSYYAMKASKRQEDLDDALRVLDEQQAKEEEMVAAAALTEEQRRKSLAAIADKYDAERAKKEEKERQVQAKERKKQAIYDMAINFAQGVMNIWSQWAKLPVVAGILTGVLSGIYGLQLAAVNSTKFAKGGILKGASHANGGVDMGNGQEAEGGEAVINKRSTAMFKPLLGLINSLGGGVNFSDVKVKPYMATGGITVPTTRNDSLMRRAFEKLAQFEPVILQGVTDRDIYRASVSGRPVGAF